MPFSVPRDPDGYVDLAAFPAQDIDLDLAGLAPVPPLAEDAWEAIVGTAPHLDPETIALDVDALVGGQLTTADGQDTADISRHVEVPDTDTHNGDAGDEPGPWQSDQIDNYRQLEADDFSQPDGIHDVPNDDS
jgi:hypothetical protein